MINKEGIPKFGKIWTLEDIAEYLRVPIEIVKEEVRTSAICTFRVGSELRVFGDEFERYLEQKRTTARIPSPAANVQSGGFSASKPFPYVWPNGRREEFKEVFASKQRMSGQTRDVVVAFSDAGKTAPHVRITVFVDRRPMVRFKPADDFEKSAVVLSIVKTLERKHLRVDDLIPPEYVGFRLEPYRDYIRRDHAPKNLAVICDKDDFETMAKHALIRAQQIEARRRELKLKSCA